MIKHFDILIELICLIVFVAIIIIAYDYYNYKKTMSKYAAINFKDFMKYYDAAPEKWSFDYHIGSFLHMLYYDSRNEIDGEEIYMNTFCGYLRLKKFYKNYKKTKMQKAKNLLMEVLEKCWQNDIKE